MRAAPARRRTVAIALAAGAAAAGALGGGGCVPFVLPPMTGAVGATRSDSYSKAGVHADFGLAPLQLWKQHHLRRWDAQLGLSYEHIDHSVWGAALAGGPIFYPWGTGSEALGRVSPQLVARLDTQGARLGVRTSIEIGSFLDGATSGSDGAAAGYGEGALGLYVEADYHSSDEVRDTWFVTAGLTVRVPFMYGIACCLR